MLNNIDKEKKLHHWFSQLTQIPHKDTNTPKNDPYRRERDIHSIIGELYNSLPKTSTKGNSKYHR